ncbi:methyltransferase domain-containing protein [Candidatus Saccharibacteria bacterium]|nr:methyltransferase domain-containing protein [Candidatus Saccharibacteria bacterium]
MFETLCVLGRQSGLSLVELESLFGDKNIKKIGNEAALLNINHNLVPFSRLGGTIKLCKVLTEINTTSWAKLTEYLVEHVPKHVCCIAPGKVKFGISVYGLNANPKAINVTGLKIKKASKSFNRSMRVIPNKSSELNAAQVLNNKMTDELGMELILVKSGSKTILAQTINVQDIDAYAARDQNRPKRDAKVGMLPPKLAQIIINLSQPKNGESILDPFCGTGVILQEALLMGFNVYGTDYQQLMIDYSNNNLEWLESKYKNKLEGLSYLLEPGDATSFEWQDFDKIACETYLGQPFSAEPKTDKLNQVIRDVDIIHKKFFKNLARQTKPGFKMCVAVPAWHTKSGIKHLPILDQLTDMGYTRMSFVHAKQKEMIYHRDGQFVGRELVVLIRK